MSTRGLKGWVINNEYHAIYNSCDSYPSALGCETLEFFKGVTERGQLSEMKEKLMKLKTVSTTPYQDGGEAFQAILKGRITEYVEYIHFIKESLFCEWAYFYNFDTGLFEIWQGFQEHPFVENIFGTGQTSNYYPCKRRGEFGVMNAPDQWWIDIAK